MFKRAVSVLLIIMMFFLISFSAYSASITFTVSISDESGSAGTVISVPDAGTISITGSKDEPITVDDQVTSINISVSVSSGYYSKIGGEVRAFASVPPADVSVNVKKFEAPSAVLTVNASGSISFSITNNSSLSISNYDIEVYENNALKTTLTGQGGSGTLPSIVEGRSYAVKAKANSGSFNSSFGTQSNAVNAPKIYNLSVKSTDGGTTGSFAGDYIAGAKVVLSATPSDGFKFKSWSSNNGGEFDDATLVGATFTMPSKDVILTASFGKTYKFVIMSSTGGKVWDVDGNYYEGEIIKISAIPGNGYVFDSWVSSDGGKFADSKAVSTTFTMPSNATTVTATFKDEQDTNKPEDNDEDTNKPETETGMFEIKTSVTGNGNIVINQNRGYEGQKITVRANAQAGYVFERWSSEGGGSFADENAAATTFIMPAGDVKIIATFIKSDGTVGIDDSKTTEGKEKTPMSRSLLVIILISSAVLAAVIVGILLILRERRKRNYINDDDFFTSNENESVVYEYESDEDGSGDGNTREIDFSDQEQDNENGYSRQNTWRQRRKRRNEYTNRSIRDDDWED